MNFLGPTLELDQSLLFPGLVSSFECGGQFLAILGQLEPGQRERHAFGPGAMYPELMQAVANYAFGKLPFPGDVPGWIDSSVLKQVVGQSGAILFLGDYGAAAAEGDPF